MDMTTVVDPDGYELLLGQHGGDLYPPYPDIGKRIDGIKTLKCRDDDIFILAFPKSGTHWTWEIIQLLFRNKAENVIGEKMDEFLEKCDKELLEEMNSPRILNTHIRPHLLPGDLINRKCKCIYIQRHPKDIMVSQYHHLVNLRNIYGYSGKFSGYFELALRGQVDYGRWFEYCLEYEDFFRSHPDIPVLRLQYEDMKQDLLSNVRKISAFCGFPVSEQTMIGIANACTFGNLKKFKTDNVDPSRALGWKDGKYNMYRKGVVGDWKNYFTVEQNERFEAEARRVLGESGLRASWV